MKKILLSLFVSLFLSSIFATAVVIDRNVDVFSPIYLQGCHFSVDIQNQVSAVTVRETFINNGISSILPRYYFPLPRGASATQLRWHINNQWHSALIAGVPQNPQGGPSSFPDNFVIYISLMPTVFDISEQLAVEDSLVMELTYTQLLPYTFGNVNLILKNDYSMMQSTPLDMQQLDLSLTSDRTITSFNLNIPGAEVSNTGYYATAQVEISNLPATTNYILMYSLQQTTIGFQVMSTLKDSIPDGFGNGFFSLIYEPTNTVYSDSLPKKITLVIDHSGSMNYEDKIQQAKNSCNYILDQLNDNDMFNVVAFNNQITHLWNYINPVTPTNISAGHNFINAISADLPYGTNISGALTFTLSQYSNAPPSYNNIIIFITDGQPTVGILDTYQLVHAIDNQVNNLGATIRLFNFGVGSDVNYQLLSILSEHNNGTAIFLGSNEIYSTITQFYDILQYEPIDNVNLSAEPINGISEIYSNPLPDIYNGTQTVITGRYTIPQTVQFNLGGTVLGEIVNYQYSSELSAITDTLLQFVPKLWASKKIDHLLVEYYSYPSTSPEAIALRQQIIEISISYGVVCVFTSFTGGETSNEDETDEIPEAEIILLGNYPNPFNPETIIRFEVLNDIDAPAFLTIYNVKGQVIRNLAIRISNKGTYEILWDGKDNNGNTVASGAYFYKITVNKYILTGKMLLLK